ncbi:MAG TPA: 50S ribosomal protein L5 [Gemmatimonadaceae bacterium]|nr:50S ribosomal protein L5 [Gemmatimonadaceae bacterium]
MATKEKKAPKGQPAGQPGGKGGKGGKGQQQKSEARSAAAAPRDHAGVGLPVPEPRLKRYYVDTVRPRLAQELQLANPHQIPTLEKIVINVGVGEAVKQPKVLDSVVEELGIITGQRPMRRKAKKSIANFGLRQGQEIGAAVTLRGARMWEFLDRLIAVAIPRIRDFRGLNTRSFDGRGNYSMGIKEQMIFPEINYDQIDQIRGMDITFVTTATRDDHAFALLRELGMPFRGEERPRGMTA